MLAFSTDCPIEQKINLYTRVFGEKPWNEGYVCPNTNELYPLSSLQTICSCCNPGVNTKLFYSKEELADIFSILSKKRGYRQNIASILENPVGFIWGWESDMNDINEDKLKLNWGEMQNLVNNIKTINPDFSLNNFYYFAEIGIDVSSRGLDIAGQLYKTQINAVIDAGTRDVLVRTTKKTDLPYKWFLKLGYMPVYFYEDKQDRVILIKTNK